MTSTRAPAARPSHTLTLRPAAPGSRARRWRGSPPLTLLAVAIGVMMVGLDGTIVAVANPAIQSHLHASLAGIQWISNAYLLALAVSLIPAGKAGDRFGHKKVFLTGVAGSSYVTVAYSTATGVQLWWGRYRGLGTGENFATDLGVSPDGSSVFVTGASAGSVEFEVDFATVAYSAR